MTSVVRAIAAWLLAVSCVHGAAYPDRWVFVKRGLDRDADVEEIRAIAQTARAHGLTGMVLSPGLDRLDLQPPAFFERVRKVKAICDSLGLEIVPRIFDIGNGGGWALPHDRHLAEGLPVRDALLLVSGGEARVAADPPVAYTNGGLEQAAGHKLAGFQLQDGPGQLSFLDREVFAEGTASLRFQNLARASGGNGRLMQEVAVQPHRHYRVSFQIKTEGLQPASGLRFEALAPDGRILAPQILGVPSTGGWRKVVWGFNSLEYGKVRLYSGIWGAKAGKFWLDDFRIEEVALLNVVRRPGTPVAVRAERGGAVYTEGTDFARIEDPLLNFDYDHDASPLRVLRGGAIQDGERLRVSYYHGVTIREGVSVCMSEPKLYRIMADQARRIHELLQPRQYLLSMDEVRTAGSCQTCRARGIPTAEILGSCLTRQVAILRAVNPNAKFWVWSDMLDPNHNAHDRYYTVEGDFSGSWKHVSKDLGIVCWYYNTRDASLAHFSGLGFRTLAAAYYDGDSLENPKRWMESLGKVRGAQGIMYATWENKYGLLADFGDLVSRSLP